MCARRVEEKEGVCNNGLVNKDATGIVNVADKVEVENVDEAVDDGVGEVES
jgi:hypothetical protein